MAEYELVREIKNCCKNNQMRDVFFEEVETEDPMEYVRGLLKGKNVELSREDGPEGPLRSMPPATGSFRDFCLRPADSQNTMENPRNFYNFPEDTG